MLLRMKEICGLRIEGKHINKIPIHTGLIPIEFEVSVKPNCLNYTLNQENHKILDITPSGLSQLSSVTCFEEQPQQSTADATTSNNTRESVYSFLIVSFRELCSVY